MGNTEWDRESAKAVARAEMATTIAEENPNRLLRDHTSKARNSEPVLLKRASRPMSGLTYGTPVTSRQRREVTISAGGEVVKTKTVSVGTVRSQTVIKAAVSDPGTYEITVNGKSAGEIVVFDSSSEDGEGANVWKCISG